MEDRLKSFLLASERLEELWGKSGILNTLEDKRLIVTVTDRLYVGTDYDYDRVIIEIEFNKQMRKQVHLRAVWDVMLQFVSDPDINSVSLESYEIKNSIANPYRHRRRADAIFIVGHAIDRP